MIDSIMRIWCDKVFAFEKTRIPALCVLYVCVAIYVIVSKLVRRCLLSLLLLSNKNFLCGFSEHLHAVYSTVHIFPTDIDIMDGLQVRQWDDTCSQSIISFEHCLHHVCMIDTFYSVPIHTGGMYILISTTSEEMWTTTVAYVLIMATGRVPPELFWPKQYE